ncbi:hypothetical protein ACFFLM_08700 [Deinococcus oregonensis]|uniref:Uncharacterized protein n=1 Tax=Deinococcus oregonensis TaxID=1805970 RepID=A0ABV6AWZ7_9DEIO
MQIKSLNISTALREPMRLLLFQPSDPVCPPEVGFTRLAQLALHQPVYLVRIEQCRPVRVVRSVPFDQLALSNLLPGATAYAAAFQANGMACLMLVARSPLTNQLQHRPSNAFISTTEQAVHSQRGKRRKERPKRERRSKPKDFS